jgi:hypothetical protein
MLTAYIFTKGIIMKGQNIELIALLRTAEIQIQILTELELKSQFADGLLEGFA